MDRSFRQKINKATVFLNDTIEQLDLIDSYRIFYPKTAEYIFFSSAHGTFSRIDLMLGHKISLNKFKRHIGRAQTKPNLNHFMVLCRPALSQGWDREWMQWRVG